MSNPLYAAARSSAAGLVDYFARHAAAAAAHPSVGSCLPDVGTVAALIDAAFWASLQREEGYVPEISLAFLPPKRAVRPLMLALTPLKTTASVDRISQLTVASTAGEAPGEASAEPATRCGAAQLARSLASCARGVPDARPDSNTTIVPATIQ